MMLTQISHRASSNHGVHTSPPPPTASRSRSSHAEKRSHRCSSNTANPVSYGLSTSINVGSKPCNSVTALPKRPLSPEVIRNLQKPKIERTTYRSNYHLHLVSSKPEIYSSGSYRSSCPSPTSLSPDCLDDNRNAFTVLDRLGPKRPSALSSTSEWISTTPVEDVRIPNSHRNHKVSESNGTCGDSHSPSVGKAETVLGNIKAVFGRWLENIRAKNNHEVSTTQGTRQKAGVTQTSGSSSIRTQHKSMSHRSSKGSLATTSGTPSPLTSSEFRFYPPKTAASSSRPDYVVTGTSGLPRRILNSDPHQHTYNVPPTASPSDRRQSMTSLLTAEVESLALAVTAATAREAEIEAAERRRRQNSSMMHSPTLSSPMRRTQINTCQAWNRMSTTSPNNLACNVQGDGKISPPFEQMGSRWTKTMEVHKLNMSHEIPSPPNPDITFQSICTSSNTCCLNKCTSPTCNIGAVYSNDRVFNGQSFMSKPTAIRNISPTKWELYAQSTVSCPGTAIATCSELCGCAHLTGNLFDNLEAKCLLNSTTSPIVPNATSKHSANQIIECPLSFQCTCTPEPLEKMQIHHSPYECWRWATSRLIDWSETMSRKRNSIGVFNGVSAILQTTEAVHRRYCTETDCVSGLRRCQSMPLINTISSSRIHVDRASPFHRLPSSVTDSERNLDCEFNIPFKDIRLIACVRKGRRKAIYRGQWHGEVMVHIFDDLNKQERANFWQDVMHLTRTRHESIALFMGACMEPPLFAIVTSACKGISLYQKLHIKHDKLWRSFPLHVLRHVAHAVDYLHSRAHPIVIRHLSSRNIFLEPKVVLSLTDYSNADCNYQHPDYVPIPSHSIRYIAPELLHDVLKRWSTDAARLAQTASSETLDHTLDHNLDDCSITSTLEGLSNRICISRILADPISQSSSYVNELASNVIGKKHLSLSAIEQTDFHLAPIRDKRKVRSLETGLDKTISTTEEFHLPYSSSVTLQLIASKHDLQAPNGTRLIKPNTTVAINQGKRRKKKTKQRGTFFIHQTMFDASTDVFAFGTLIFELHTRRYPFQNSDIRTYLDHVCSGYRDEASGSCFLDSMRLLMLQCWSHVPSKRPVSRQIIQQIIENHALCRRQRSDPTTTHWFPNTESH